MTADDPKQQAVDENYDAFSKMLPELMKTHAGKFAVMHNRQAVQFFDTLRDAMLYAAKAYPNGLFSVQEVTDKAIDLGWFSDAYLPDTLQH